MRLDVIEYSSCQRILIPGWPYCWDGCQCPLNYLFWKKIHNPREPDASVNKEKVSEFCHRGDRNSLIPFHWSTPSTFQCPCRNLRLALWLWWWGFLTPLVRWIIPYGKRRPGAITLQAKLKVPNGDWSSCRVVDRRDWKYGESGLILSTLSSGILAFFFPQN